MRASPTRAGTDVARASGLVSPVEKRSELGLESDMGRIEHLAAGHDDDVEPARRFVMAEQLPDQAFGSVPDHGRAHLPGSGDAEPCASPTIGNHEHRHQAT